MQGMSAVRAWLHDMSRSLSGAMPFGAPCVCDRTAEVTPPKCCSTGAPSGAAGADQGAAAAGGGAAAWKGPEAPNGAAGAAALPNGAPKVAAPALAPKPEVVACCCLAAPPPNVMPSLDCPTGAAGLGAPASQCKKSRRARAGAKVAGCQAQGCRKIEQRLKSESLPHLRLSE